MPAPSSTHSSLVAIESRRRPDALRARRLPVSQGRPQGARPPTGAAADRARRRQRRCCKGGLVLGGRSMGGRMCSMVVGDADDPLPAQWPGADLVSAAPARQARLAARRAPAAPHGAVPVHPRHARSVRLAGRVAAVDGDHSRRGHPPLDRGQGPRPQGRRRGHRRDRRRRGSQLSR